MSQVTEQSVRFQTALASIKLIQASAVLDLTEDDFDFLTSNKVWIATDRSRARRCVEACRSEERFSRNAETEIVCRPLLETKNASQSACRSPNGQRSTGQPNAPAISSTCATCSSPAPGTPSTTSS